MYQSLSVHEHIVKFTGLKLAQCTSDANHEKHCFGQLIAELKSILMKNTNELCAVYVDMGTTNTRVWLADGDRVVWQAKAAVGVRDTAREGSSAKARTALRDLITQVRLAGEKITSTSATCVPSHVIAAGMITSQLGLREVPHVHAPAGLAELAAHVKQHHFPDVTDLPFLLVPGVRSGPLQYDREIMGAVDVMRGEETLCLGLLALGLMQKPSVLLNLGSHWKAIRLDADGRIASSVTSMAGELIHAAQTQTVLASAVPHERPMELDEEWVEAGMAEQRRSGLARALFCVRLLEQACGSTPAQRLAFLVGTFIAADLDALMARGVLNLDVAVYISGGQAVAAAWQRALTQSSVCAIALTETQVERALLTGLKFIATAAARSLQSP